MEAKMSIQTRKELLFHILKRYKRASWISESPPAEAGGFKIPLVKRMERLKALML
jgi:hypothetical protein